MIESRRLILTIAATGVLLISGCGVPFQGESRTHQEVEPKEHYPSTHIQFEYPPEVSLQEAREQAKFAALFPDEDAANDTNLVGAFLESSGDQLFLKFPPRGDPSGVRQSHIEIVETPWQFKRAPAEVWAGDVERYPRSAHTVDLHGLDALVIEPRSPHDEEQANPAYVRFRVRGVDVSVSGGDDTRPLLDIADDLAAQGLSEPEDR